MKNKFYFILLMLISSGLAACSSSSKKAAQASSVKVEIEDHSNSTTDVMAKTQATKAIRVNFNSNELITKISEYIAQNPETTLKKIVGYANSLKSEIGLPFTLIVSNAEIIGTETFIKTEKSVRLNVGIGSEPLCASGIAVTYPVLRRDGDIWIIRYKSGEHQIKAAPLRVGDIRRNKDGQLETKVALPEEGLEPGGIDRSGESIFVRFDLNPATSSWWRRIMKRNPKEEKPFLVLEMGESEFEFSDDPDHYSSFDDAPPRETQEDDYILRFEDSKYYFQSMTCG